MHRKKLLLKPKGQSALGNRKRLLDRSELCEGIRDLETLQIDKIMKDWHVLY